MLAAAITAAAVMTMAFPAYGNTSITEDTVSIPAAEAEERSLSFGDAVSALYAGSSDMTDDMVLEAARQIFCFQS